MAYRTRFKRQFVTSYPVKKFIRRSRKIYLPGFDSFSLHEIWRPFVQQLRKTSLVERAAAISFNTVMAIPPTLIFFFTLIPYLPISQSFITELYVLIKDIIPGEQNHTAIIQFLDDFLSRPRNELLSFGLLLALIFSSNAMMGVLRSFDKNYVGFTKRKGFKKRQVALKMTLIQFVLVFLFICLLVAQGAVLNWLGVENKWMIKMIENFRWLLIFGLLFLIVSSIYRYGPAVQKKWPYFTPGAVFATVLMVIATFLVSWWITNFSNYNKLYGSLGAIFILMVLIYINALAVLMGFELNVTIASLKRRKDLIISKRKLNTLENG